MTTPQLEEQFLHLLETNSGFRERVRQQLLGAEILELPARLAELAQTVASLAQAVHEFIAEQRQINARQAEHNARMDAFVTQQVEHNARMDAFVTQQGQVNAQQAEHNARMDAFVTEQGQVNAQQAEHNARMDAFVAEQRQVNATVERMRGDVDLMRGDVDLVRGDLDLVRGDLDLVRGDLDLVRGDLDQVRNDVDRMRGDVGRLRGDGYEHFCVANLRAILDGYLDWPNLADRDWINNLLYAARQAQRITRAELIDGYNPDIIAQTGDDTPPAEFAVIETSITCNEDDVGKAARRAELISRVTGVPASPYLVTHYAPAPAVQQAAHRLSVTLVQLESERHGAGTPGSGTV